MISTITFVAIFVSLLVAAAVSWALFLKIGLAWAGVPDVTTRRVVVTTGTVFVLLITVDILCLFATPSTTAQLMFLGLVQVALAATIPCVVIVFFFKASFLRAVQAWLPTLLASFGIGAFAVLVVRPFLYEAFIVPTNSMAPTLVGIHWQDLCPECGQPNYGTVEDERYALLNPPQMICDNFHVAPAPNVEKRVHPADCFLVAKFLAPRRWDLVAFQYPGDPQELYAKRLVGLPGERIHIKDGFVWVNGEKQTPPDSIRGIEYLSHLPDWPQSELWGSADRPALLGDDEYFVLGDFSARLTGVGDRCTWP
jgi:signal peptidase I